MRHENVISEHPITIGFHGLTGCQRDPLDRGITRILWHVWFLFFKSKFENIENTKIVFVL